MNSWKIILATVVIFGAGVLTGGVLVNYVNHAQPKLPHRPPPESAQHPQVENPEPSRQPGLPKPRQPDWWKKQFVQQLDDKLQLTPEQHEKIAGIITSGQERIREISTNTTAQTRQVIQNARQQIHAVLTAEQWKVFEELMKQRAPRKSPATNAPLNWATPTNRPPTNAPGA
jgi:Spy/CpxP family protein refolding chaperone